MVNTLDLILSYYVYEGRPHILSLGLKSSKKKKKSMKRRISDATGRKGHRCLLNPAITVNVDDATTSPVQDRSIPGPFHREGFPAQGTEG